jgi:rhodanese-related sulfurtransferase
MAVKRVDPNEAAALLDAGWAYLDVRSVPEFDQGHPAGAYSIPLLHMDAAGTRTPNPEFLDAVRRAFPTDAKVVVGCRTGVRSLKAAGLMLEAGYADVVDMRGGWAGERDPGGAVTAGWSACGLPASTTAEPGRSWAELAARRP